MPPTSSSRTFFWQLLVVVFVLGSFVVPRTAAASSLPVTGWAWGGTNTISADPLDSFVGWISLSTTTPPVYGVSEDSVTGALSGYAWSSNLGWITFNSAEVSGCPSAPCAPSVNLSTGNITGWARACAAFASGCSGALDSNSAVPTAWDGWISLSGVTQNLSTCAWTGTGYAWGSDSIGAISMSGPTYGVGCTLPPDLTAANVPENTATAGTAKAFTSLITNGPAAGTGNGFTDLLEVDNDSNHTLFTDIYDVTKTYSSAAIAASGNNTASVSYTFPSPGTWYVRFCADTNSSNVGSITETNENNNCSPSWTTVNVTSALSATLSANTYTIDKGTPVILTWNATPALGATCGAAGGGTWLLAGSPASGTKSDSPTVDPSNYQVHCIKGTDFVDSNIVTINVVSPTISISAKPTCISGGGSSKISWSATPASQITSCTISSNPTGPGFPITQSTGPFSGSQTATVSGKSTYTIACVTKGGSTITKSVIVDVRSCWTEF